MIRADGEGDTKLVAITIVQVDCTIHLCNSSNSEVRFYIMSIYFLCILKKLFSGISQFGVVRPSVC